MAEQVSFIGREHELAEIEQLVRERDTRRVVCIHGPGGIGKTRLLKEVYKRYSDDRRTRLLMAGIIDFDDRSLHFPGNVDRRITQLLGEESFEPYLRELRDLRKMEMAGVSLEKLNQQRESVHQAVIDGFNQISSKRRVILLLDTTDTLGGTEVWDRLTALFFRSKNALFLLAGRNAMDLWQSLQPRLSKDAQLINLQPLDAADREDYLERKQRRLHITVEPDLAQRLLLLTQGRPILIDLAAEWISRAIPLPWMTDGSLDDFESLSDEERKQQQEVFEAQLVGHITQIRTPMNRLSLVMSHVYPLDVEMVQELLELPKKAARELLKEAQTYTFVRSLPDGRISLHDEMRRMVDEYVWPDVDADGDRRRLDSNLAATCLERKIRAREERIAQLKRSDLTKSEIAQELADLERGRWVVLVDWAHYALRADWPKGIAVFAKVFDEAVRYKQPDVCGLLLNLVKENLVGAIQKKWHDRDARYEYEIRLARQALDRRELEEGHNILESLQADYPEQRRQVDILTRLARYAELLGNLEKAVTYHEQALAMCQARSEIMAAWGGTILNNLGRMHRLMGRWEEAEEHYRQGIDLLRKAGDEVRLATAYNNLGYIIGLRSNYDSALRYCHRSLAMQEPLGLKHDLGRTHNTLGIIYRGKENYSSSLEHTDRALTVFQEIEDKEWMSIAYCERGITKWHMGQLKAADIDLEQSHQIYKETGLDLELVSILHRRGHVAWELGETKEAEEFFRESAEIGRRVSDFQQTVNSLEGLVELYYDIGYEYHRQGDVENRDEWYAKAEEMAMQWKGEFEDKGYYFPLYSGSRHRTLGNIVYDRGDYDTALQRYLEAYPRIASRGGYSKYMLPEALDWLQERIDQLPPRLAMEWCDRIQEDWEEEGRDRDFPEMISVCEIGRDNARRRVVKQRESDHE